MKCPKCGYNSFEYHDICKKCSADFSVYKETYSITPIVLSPEARVEKANEFRSAASANKQPVEKVETHDDMFAFALPEEPAPPTSSATQNDDPFNFGEDLPEVAQSPASSTTQNDELFKFDIDTPEVASALTSPVTEKEPFGFDEDLPEVAPQQAKVENGGFFDPLESTSTDADDPFASNTLDSPAPPAEEAAPPSGSSEYDLENFSWDDTPTAVITSEEQGGVQSSVDDFDSLFGDTSDSAKK